MCGRYALAGDFSAFTRDFDLDEVPGLVDRYNIAPSGGVGYEAPIITAQGLVFARFWYISPRYRGTIAQLPTSFNARSESVLTKHYFEGGRPCLVPTSGFREFPGASGHKRAVCFYSPPVGHGDRPMVDNSDIAPATAFFAFAGIYSQWRDEASSTQAFTFAILTTDANEVVAPHHDRMPLLVPRAKYEAWSASGAQLDQLLHGAVDDARAVPLLSYDVSNFGNSTRVEGPDCIRPARRQLSLF